MNKKRNLIYFSLLLLLFNCSFDSKTGIWSGAEDEVIRIAKLEQAQIKATNRTKVYSSQNYYFKEKALKRDVWEHILRQVSRIENLFDDNRNNTYLDGRLVSMRINEKTAEEEEIEGLNVIKWEFRGKYFSNQS